MNSFEDFGYDYEPTYPWTFKHVFEALLVGILLGSGLSQAVMWLVDSNLQGREPAVCVCQCEVRQ